MRAAESKWSDGKKSSRRKIRALNIPKSAWNQSCIGVDGQKSEHEQFLRSWRRCSCSRELRILRKMKCDICKLADLESTAQTPGSSQDVNSEGLK